MKTRELYFFITFYVISQTTGFYNKLYHKCEVLETRACLGVSLDYDYTTTELVSDSKTQKDVQKKLEEWEGLRFLPKCWEVLQPLLCQVYMPKCENDTVELPCKEQCLATRKPCSVVESYQQWPEFLQCDKLPQGKCNGTLKKLHLNESACKAPLVETAHKPSWYENIEGCGIQCMNPIFSEEEHTRIHRFVAAFGTLTTICTLFTVVTFLVGWKSQSKYPSVILFFMNACFCVASIGFLIQFCQGARKLVVCRRDDTMRLGEPNEKDSFLCLLTFILVYYFSLAGMAWFVVLAYSWCICFKTLGSTRDNFVGKTGYFHAVSWSLPAILTTAVLLSKQVDSNSISGICFVGYKNPDMRAGFLLCPLGLDVLIGGFFLSKGLFILFKLRKSNPDFLSSRASIKIKETIVRVGFFAFVAFAFVFITFACHVYEYYNQRIWEQSYKDFIMCIAQREVKGRYNECAINKRPSLSVIELGLSSLFGAGIAMSGWTWTSNTFKTWKKLWHRITRKQRYPELSHYRLIRRMRKNRIGPGGGPAVLFTPESRLPGIMGRGEARVNRRKSRIIEEPSLQLLNVSEITSGLDPAQLQTERTQIRRAAGSVRTKSIDSSSHTTKTQSNSSSLLTKIQLHRAAGSVQSLDSTSHLTKTS